MKLKRYFIFKNIEILFKNLKKLLLIKSILNNKLVNY